MDAPKLRKRYKFTGPEDKKLRGSWTNMLRRCYDPECSAYRLYGGRGIGVDKRWWDYPTFRDDVGFPPQGMTLDRINNDGNYEPGNVRWATRREQVLNRRNTVWIDMPDGRRLCVREAARELGVSPSTIHIRLHRGQDPLKATARNNDARKIWITWQGQTKDYAGWAKELGLTREGFWLRYKEFRLGRRSLEWAMRPRYG